jgi:hypothetical protein
MIGLILPYFLVWFKKVKNYYLVFERELLRFDVLRLLAVPEREEPLLLLRDALRSRELALVVLLLRRRVVPLVLPLRELPRDELDPPRKLDPPRELEEPRDELEERLELDRFELPFLFELPFRFELPFLLEFPPSYEFPPRPELPRDDPPRDEPEFP